MRKSLILGILLSVALTSFAYEPLDSLFDALSSLKHTSATNVKYSGSFSPECPGFFLQQPDGEGWTEGVRLTLSNISNTEGERLLEIFDKSEDYLGFLLSKGSMRGCLDEEIKTVYCGYYDSTTHTFHFLRAGVED